MSDQLNAVEITSIDDAMRQRRECRRQIDVWLVHERNYREMRCDRRALEFFRIEKDGMTFMNRPIYTRY